MQKLKLALVAAALVLPLGSLNASSDSADVAIAPSVAASQGSELTGPDGQSWGCCWVMIMGRWMCVPC